MPVHLERRVRPSRPRRVLALSALGLGLAGFASIVAAVIDQPLRALVLGTTTLVVLGALATALTTRGPRRATALLVGAAALVVGVAATVALRREADQDTPRLAIGVVALAGSAVAARASLQVPPPRDPAHLRVPEGSRPVHHPVVLVNLRSGGGKAERFGLVPACEQLGIDTRVLEPGDDLVALAESAVADGADALGMAGGDGSLGLVAAVAMAHDLPFTPIPVGTRNHFALDIGLDRADPLQALAAFTAGEEHRIDVGSVNDRVFLNNVALGMYGAVVAHPEYRGAKLGTALAELPEAVAKGGRAYALELDVPGQGHWEEAALVMVANNPYETSPPRAMGRRRRLDGGSLGVVAIDMAGAGSVASITTFAALSATERSPHVWAWSTPTFEVGSPHATVPAGIDGEAVELDTPVRFATRPGALRLLLPPGSRVGFDQQDLGAAGVFQGLMELILTGEPPEARPPERRAEAVEEPIGELLNAATGDQPDEGATTP